MSHRSGRSSRQRVVRVARPPLIAQELSPETRVQFCRIKWYYNNVGHRPTRYNRENIPAWFREKYPRAEFEDHWNFVPTRWEQSIAEGGSYIESWTLYNQCMAALADGEARLAEKETLLQLTSALESDVAQLGWFRLNN